MSLSPEQMEIRRTRVGASEVAALIPPAADGTVVHPHGRGPMDVFAAKNGVQKPSTPEQRWGTIVESAILQMHCESQGLEVLPNPGTLIHPQYPWLCATPDAIAKDSTGARRLIECKNSGRWMMHLWGAEGTGEVPIGYSAQIQITLSVLLAHGLIDSTEADLTACIGGMPPVPYIVELRPHLFDHLAELARLFVVNHLEPGVPPEQGWDSDAAEAWLRKKYPTSSEALLEATAEDMKLARQVSIAQKRIKRWGSVEAEGKNRLRARIGEASGIIGIATNKLTKAGTRVLRLAKGWMAA